MECPRFITLLYADVENGGLEKFGDFPKIMKRTDGEARYRLAENTYVNRDFAIVRF